MSTDTGAEDRALILLDTSAAVALVLEDHDRHEAVRSAVQGRQLGLAGHAWFETYSVLTRLPAGMRRSPGDASRLLTRNFPVSVFLSATQASELRLELARLGIAGGAVYDALVGAVTREHGAALLSADVRARSTYEALGIDVEFV